MVCHEQLLLSRHATEAAARVEVSAISLRRHAWLRTAVVPDDTRKHVEKMPFDGEGVFSQKTDEALKADQTLKKTAKTYSSQTPGQGPRTNVRRFPWRRPFYNQQGSFRNSRPFSDRNRQTSQTPRPANRPYQDKGKQRSSFRRGDKRHKSAF